MADHCRLFALSDPKELAFQAQCGHHHDDTCDRNDQLMSSLSEIESAMIAQTYNLLPEVKEELSFTVKQAKTNIYAWRAHIVCSSNQDAARIDILESLEESSVLVILGYEIFAEKIPRKPNRLVWQTWHYLAHQRSLQKG